MEHIITSSVSSAGIMLSPKPFFLMMQRCSITAHHERFRMTKSPLTGRHDIHSRKNPSLPMFPRKKKTHSCKSSSRKNKSSSNEKINFLIGRIGIFFQQQSFVYAKNVYENSLGWNIALLHDYSSVVQMPNGYLTAFLERRDLSRQADATIKLADFCRAHHVAFLMVLGPGKIKNGSLCIRF